MKIVIAIICACIFPIINLIFRFKLIYNPQSTTNIEKKTFEVSSLLVVCLWTILCIAVFVMLFLIDGEMAWWLKIIFWAFFSLLYYVLIKRWKESYELSKMNFNS